MIKKAEHAHGSPKLAGETDVMDRQEKQGRWVR